jgi:site-specific recombinase XerD
MEGAHIKSLLVKEGITPQSVEHRNEQRIKLVFSYDAQKTDAVKKIAGRKWSKTMRAWHIPRDKKLLEELISLLHYNTKPPPPGGKDEKNGELPYWIYDYVRHLKIRGYSYSTQKNYKSMALLFAFHFKDKDAAQLEKKDVEQWLEYLHDVRKYKSSGLNTAVNAVKFLYEKVWEKPRSFYTFPRAKKVKAIPKFFQQSDIEKIFAGIENVKHKVILYTAYSGGLRVGEIVNLKVTDIYSGTNQLRIEQAKGKKDRYVMLSAKLLNLLREYYKKYHPAYWLFEGPHNEPYSTRSVQLIFKRAKQQAGIRREGSIHALRHSFATHLLESGIDVTLIKELLGHTSLRTTMGYTHITKPALKRVKSPLDNLNL